MPVAIERDALASHAQAICRRAAATRAQQRCHLREFPLPSHVKIGSVSRPSSSRFRQFAQRSDYHASETLRCDIGIDCLFQIVNNLQAFVAGRFIQFADCDLSCRRNCNCETVTLRPPRFDVSWQRDASVTSSCFEIGRYAR